MSRPVESRDRNAPAADGNDNVRLFVSFLLFLHLFALAVGIGSRATATLDGRETLAMRLRNVPHKSVPLLQAYVQLLWMDLSYTYHLTYGPPGDMAGDSALWIDVDLELADGSTLNVRLPDDNIMLPLRRQHYEGLARRAGAVADNANMSGTIPQGIAARLVAETGAVRGRIYIRQAELPATPFVPASGNVRTLYEAAILVSPEGVGVSKISAASESAPAAASEGAR